MKWKVKQRKPEEYKKWFAWHPVTIGDHIIWFEYIERLRWVDHDAFPSMNGTNWNTEYRLLND